MREILFRGKPYNSGLCYQHCPNGWMYGFYAKKGGASYITEVGKYASGKPYFLDSIVDPETVGQFTGMTDKSGKKIFEGDIVSIGGHIATVDGLYLVIYDTANHCWALKRRSEYHHHYFTFSDLNGFADTSSVVGNIHDNPELLEVRE